MRKLLVFLIVTCILASMLLVSSGFCRNKDRVFYKQKGDCYDVYYINTKGKTQLIDSLPREPFINKHSKNLVEYGFSFGTPSGYSRFVDTTNDKISSKDGFFVVMAVESNRQLVAELGSSLDCVYVWKIFDAKKPLLKIKRGFNGSNISDAKFKDKNHLYLKYEDENGKDKKEIFFIK